jgi:hypothetical protein
MRVVGDEIYDQLRRSLQDQSNIQYSLDEAKEIGDALIHFYVLLLKLNDERRGANNRGDNNG